MSSLSEEPSTSGDPPGDLKSESQENSSPKQAISPARDESLLPIKPAQEVCTDTDNHSSSETGKNPPAARQGDCLPSGQAKSGSGDDGETKMEVDEPTAFEESKISTETVMPINLEHSDNTDSSLNVPPLLSEKTESSEEHSKTTPSGELDGLKSSKSPTAAEPDPKPPPDKGAKMDSVDAKRDESDMNKKDDSAGSKRDDDGGGAKKDDKIDDGKSAKKDDAEKPKKAQKTGDIDLVTLDSSDSDEPAGGSASDSKPDSKRASSAPADKAKSSPAAPVAKIPRCCLNPDCKSREGLLSAVSADLVYFAMVHGDSDQIPAHVHAGGRRAKICAVCRLLVEKYNKLMSELVREGKPILDGVVRQKDDEVCLDSDEEDEKDKDEAEDDSSESVCSDVSMFEVDQDIEERIQAAMASIKFDDQLDQCVQWVQEKQAAIDDSFSKTERELARLEKCVHYLYEDLYKERPPTKGGGTRPTAATAGSRQDKSRKDVVKRRSRLTQRKRSQRTCVGVMAAPRRGKRARTRGERGMTRATRVKATEKDEGEVEHQGYTGGNRIMNGMIGVSGGGMEDVNNIVTKGVEDMSQDVVVLRHMYKGDRVVTGRAGEGYSLRQRVDSTESAKTCENVMFDPKIRQASSEIQVKKGDGDVGMERIPPVSTVAASFESLSAIDGTTARTSISGVTRQEMGPDGQLSEKAKARVNAFESDIEKGIGGAGIKRRLPVDDNRCLLRDKAFVEDLNKRWRNAFDTQKLGELIGCNGDKVVSKKATKNKQDRMSDENNNDEQYNSEVGDVLEGIGSSGLEKGVKEFSKDNTEQGDGDIICSESHSTKNLKYITPQPVSSNSPATELESAFEDWRRRRIRLMENHRAEIKNNESGQHGNVSNKSAAFRDIQSDNADFQHKDCPAVVSQCSGGATTPFDSAGATAAIQGSAERAGCMVSRSDPDPIRAYSDPVHEAKQAVSAEVRESVTLQYVMTNAKRNDKLVLSDDLGKAIWVKWEDGKPVEIPVSCGSMKLRIYREEIKETKSLVPGTSTSREQRRCWQGKNVIISLDSVKRVASLASTEVRSTEKSTESRQSSSGTDGHESVAKFPQHSGAVCSKTARLIRFERVGPKSPIVPLTPRKGVAEKVSFQKEGKNKEDSSSAVATSVRLQCIEEEDDSRSVELSHQPKHFGENPNHLRNNHCPDPQDYGQASSKSPQNEQPCSELPRVKDTISKFVHSAHPRQVRQSVSDYVQEEQSKDVSRNNSVDARQVTEWFTKDGTFRKERVMLSSGGIGHLLGIWSHKLRQFIPCSVEWDQDIDSSAIKLPVPESLDRTAARWASEGISVRKEMLKQTQPSGTDACSSETSDAKTCAAPVPVQMRSVAAGSEVQEVTPKTANLDSSFSETNILAPPVMAEPHEQVRSPQCDFRQPHSASVPAASEIEMMINREQYTQPSTSQGVSLHRTAPSPRVTAVKFRGLETSVNRGRLMESKQPSEGQEQPSCPQRRVVVPTMKLVGVEKQSQQRPQVMLPKAKRSGILAFQPGRRREQLAGIVASTTRPSMHLSSLSACQPLYGVPQSEAQAQLRRQKQTLEPRLRDVLEQQLPSKQAQLRPSPTSHEQLPRQQTPLEQLSKQETSRNQPPAHATLKQPSRQHILPEQLPSQISEEQLSGQDTSPKHVAKQQISLQQVGQQTPMKEVMQENTALDQVALVAQQQTPMKEVTQERTALDQVAQAVDHAAQQHTPLEELSRILDRYPRAAESDHQRLCLSPCQEQQAISKTYRTLPSPFQPSLSPSSSQESLPWPWIYIPQPSERATRLLAQLPRPPTVPVQPSLIVRVPRPSTPRSLTLSELRRKAPACSRPQPVPPTETVTQPCPIAPLMQESRRHGSWSRVPSDLRPSTGKHLPEDLPSLSSQVDNRSPTSLKRPSYQTRQVSAGDQPLPAKMIRSSAVDQAQPFRSTCKQPESILQPPPANVSRSSAAQQTRLSGLACMEQRVCFEPQPPLRSFVRFTGGDDTTLSIDCRDPTLTRSRHRHEKSLSVNSLCSDASDVPSGIWQKHMALTSAESGIGRADLENERTASMALTAALINSTINHAISDGHVPSEDPFRDIPQTGPVLVPAAATSSPPLDSSQRVARPWRLEDEGPVSVPLAQEPVSLPNYAKVRGPILTADRDGRASTAPTVASGCRQTMGPMCGAQLRKEPSGDGNRRRQHLVVDLEQDGPLNANQENSSSYDRPRHLASQGIAPAGRFVEICGELDGCGGAGRGRQRLAVAIPPPGRWEIPLAPVVQTLPEAAPDGGWTTFQLGGKRGAGQDRAAVATMSRVAEMARELRQSSIRTVPSQQQSASEVRAGGDGQETAERIEQESLGKPVNSELQDLDAVVDYRARTVGPIQSLPSIDIFHSDSERTIRYPDGRVYDLDPQFTARLMPPTTARSGAAMPPPPPLLPKPSSAAPGRGRAGSLAAVRKPGDKPVGDIMISDVVQVGKTATPVDLPPLGTIQRPLIKPGQHVFAMHSDSLSPWFKAKVKDVMVKSSGTKFRVKFDSPRVTSNKNRVVSGSEVAYVEQATVRLHVGVRVVAAFRHHAQQTPTFYSGTIAEAPKAMNGYRYLIFFDDGYAAYVQHRELKLICTPSKNAADDVHPDQREFMQKYLAQFPERPMVKLLAGQVVKTEYEGKWMPAKVAEVDASLVKMIFESERHSEWIYRGSARLAPMYAELVPHQPRKLGTGTRRNILNAVNVGKKNRVYVEYTRHSEREDEEDTSEGTAKSPVVVSATPRAVARKSTASAQQPASPPPMPSDRLISPISPMEGDGQIVEIVNKPRVTPRRLQPHQCSRACIRNFSVDMDHFKGSNPLLMPMMSGWIREIVRHRTSKRTVLYRAPCGRRLRSLDEVFSFLRRTGCQLEIDCFCFDFWVHCFTEFEPARKFCSIKDISYGKENVPVSCVNSLNRDYPDYVEYSTRRLPTPGVHLNLDSDFLTCCDCTDDCQDKSKCSCWQSTIQGTAFGPTGQIDDTAGYHYRRLINGNVVTGIYECNDRCRCRRSCLNRVCQHPLRLRLQVFKTLRRGWGIRCLDDIPKGGFICVYAGQLLTESHANEDGKNYGDEYLAELDYIEVLERLKEGYESDVVEDEEESSDEKQDEEKSDEDASGGNDDDTGGESESSDSTRRRHGMRDDDFVPRREVPAGGKSDQDLRRSNRSRQPKNLDSEDSETKKKKTTVAKTVESKKTSGHKDDSSKSNSRKDSESGRTSGLGNRLSLPDENYKSVREQFGTDEYCYIMDAKTIGNLGRYLNHSCSPNVFVQNVFVDTHDLRFPWVAFFALSYIRAGTELTWDYNYEVGSVPGKVMYCHCGSQECRGRLL